MFLDILEPIPPRCCVGFGGFNRDAEGVAMPPRDLGCGLSTSILIISSPCLNKFSINFDSSGATFGCETFGITGLIGCETFGITGLIGCAGLISGVGFTLGLIV